MQHRENLKTRFKFMPHIQLKKYPPIFFPCKILRPLQRYRYYIIKSIDVLQLSVILCNFSPVCPGFEFGLNRPLY